MNKFIYVGIIVLCFFKANNQKYEPCLDRYTQCKLWKEQNMCLMSTYRDYMIRTCPVSCKFCKNNDEGSPPFPSGNISPSPPIPPQNSPIIPITSPTTKEPELPPIMNSAGIYYQPIAQNLATSFNNSYNSHFKIEPTDSKPEAEKNSSEKISNYVTTLPQAMKLIQSLSQMISQTSNKKVERISHNMNSKSAVQENSHKKYKLENLKRKTNPIVSRREMVDEAELDDNEEINMNNNVIRMMIQNKRSSVQRSNDVTNKNKRKQKHYKKSNDIKKHGQARIKTHHKNSVPKSYPYVYMTNISSPSTATTTTTTTTTPLPPLPPSPPSPPIASFPSLPSIQSPVTLSPASLITYTQSYDTESTTEETTTYSTTSPDLTTTLTTPPPPPLPMPMAPPVIQSVPTAQTTTEPEQQCDDCQTRYSIILLQRFDAEYEDTTSSKYSMLKGNLVQDIEYTLGPDSVVSEVEFEEVSGKTDNDSLTRAYFDLGGDLSKLDDLLSQVNKGNVNGLLVKPYSIRKE